MTEPARTWRGLDGLRGVAVIAVVLYHLGYADSGFLGVDLFFVLSGFLITGLVLKEHQRTGGVALLRFYSRRALRLYPALLAVVAFCTLGALATGQPMRRFVHDAVASLLYVGNIVPLHSGLLDHTWTLALEEQFYLVWPALLLVALRGDGPRRYLPATLVVGLVLVGDLLHGQQGALHSYVRAMGLPLGCALALVRPAVRARLSHAGPVAFGLLVVAVFAQLPSWVTTGWPVSAGALLAVPVVPWLVLRPPSLMTSAPLRWFGLRSYSLYLWHLPLISLAMHHTPDRLGHGGRVALAVTASLVAAELSYRLVERPMLALRDRRVPGESQPLPRQ